MILILCRNRSLRKLALTLTLGVGAAVMLSGCLVTAPYWNQSLANHTQSIPIQAWTNHKSSNVRVECHKAAHYGLYPWGGPQNWQFVTNISPSQNASLDPQKSAIYSVGKNVVLPASCWRHDGTNYKTAIRLRQLKPKLVGPGNEWVTYNGFTKSGLECLGEKVGEDASWYGYLNEGCEISTPYIGIHASN